MNNNKKAFLSYSHLDKDFANKIAKELQKNGVDVWWDKWEIQVGDSLIQKIFEEGLSECDIFLILISKNSVNSKWVKEELSAAIVSKLAGVKKIIPIIKEKCDIPLSLRSLMWVDLSEDFSEGIRKITKSIFNVTEKPPVGKIPDYISKLKNGVGGLSKLASTIGYIMLKRESDHLGFEKAFKGKALMESTLNFTSEEMNDAIDELEEYGLVKTNNYLGADPFNFGDVEPTYALFLHFKDNGLEYDPYEDIKKVASAIVAKKEVEGNEIKQITNLPPIRINRAVSYLDDYGYIDVVRTLGTVPFSFRTIMSNRKTRQFVSNNCK